MIGVGGSSVGSRVYLSEITATRRSTRPSLSFCPLCPVEEEEGRNDRNEPSPASTMKCGSNVLTGDVVVAAAPAG